MRKMMLLAALLFTGYAPAALAAENKTSTEINRPAASNFTYDMNVGEYERFSIQTDLSDLEAVTSTFAGGTVATMTLTMTDYTGLIGRKSSATITLVDGANTAVAIGDEYITINGRRYTEGVEWSRVVGVATMTAKGLRDVINAHWEYDANVASNVITVWALSSGTAANSWTISSSSPTALTATAWSGGQEYGFISINGTKLTEGTDFVAATSSHVTTNAIAAAINANATLAALVSVSSSVNGVNLGFMRLNTLVAGAAEYPVTVSNTSHLTPNKNKLDDGAPTDVSLSGDSITEASHGFATGMGVVYSTGSNLTVGGLSHAATYYVIRVDDNTYKLASSANNADAGTAIDLTSAGNATFTLIPQAFASAASDGIKWLGSNDGTSYYDLSTTTVPYTADGGAVTSFADFPYKYLRLSFTKPTTGALNVKAVFNGRK